MILNNILEKCLQWLSILIGFGWGGRKTISYELKYVKSIIKKGAVFIDCGGNIGDYTNEIIKRFNNPEVHIFEPSLVCVEKLAKRFSFNQKVKINQLGLSNTNTDLLLYSDKFGSSLASLTKRNLKHFHKDFNLEEKIKVIKFKEYWKENINAEVIDLFKIDVEGHEMDVLEGIGDKISKIRLIQFEFGGCNIDTRTFFQDFWYFFNKNNFKIFRISPLGLIELVQYKEIYESFVTTNFLCVNKKLL